MAIKERNTTKETQRAEAFEGSGLFGRLNAFGERHAKLIIFISVALLIVTVLIFAKVLYDRSVSERAAKDIVAADTVDKLKELKKKYKDTPVLGEIMYRLANKYYEENKLRDAESEYREFLEKFKDHPLGAQVQKALVGLDANIRFLEDQKERVLKYPTLQTHPEKRAKVKDDRFPILPPKAENPTAVIDFGPGKGKVTIELYEDMAPNTVSDFVKLAESKYFDGLKWDSVGSGEALRIKKKETGGVDYFLPAEDSQIDKTDGTVLMRKAENRPELEAADFQFLLKDLPDLKEGTVFGRVSEDSRLALKALLPEDAIVSVTIEKKRKDSKYEPQTVKP